MRPIMDMDTVQIEITNACIKSCANCTRFCGHVQPYFMSFDQFKEAVDSMVGYPKMVGIMGGEPILHPQFDEFCEYALSKIPRQQLGLWTSFPKGYEKHREIICKTFKHILLNDHTRDDVYHHPFLVAIEECIPDDTNKMFYMINSCSFQMSWSASINPRGAWFCEIAASMSMLFEEGEGWKVEPGWWWKQPWDFKEQIEKFCPKCGGAVPHKRRKSVETVDDISPKNLEKLKGKSRRVDKGEYVVSDLKTTTKLEPLASYKDFHYRNHIAERYGIFLTINNQFYWEPHLKKHFEARI